MILYLGAAATIGGTALEEISDAAAPFPLRPIDPAPASGSQVSYRASGRPVIAGTYLSLIGPQFPGPARRVGGIHQ